MKHPTIRIDTTPFAGLDRLSRHLGYHARRQQTIAANLANIDTPGYRSKDLSFQESFVTHAGRPDPVRTVSHSEEVLTLDDEVPDQDGNSVSLEHQMARSVANTLRFSALSEIISRNLGMLKYAARDGS